MSPVRADRTLLIDEVTLREALDRARWGEDADTILDDLWIKREIEEVESE